MPILSPNSCEYDHEDRCEIPWDRKAYYDCIPWHDAYILTDKEDTSCFTLIKTAKLVR